MDLETESEEDSSQEEDSDFDVDSDAVSVYSTTSSSSLPVGEPSLKVFIKQFPPSVTKRDIKDHLSVCGVSDHVKSIRIYYDKTKKKSKGCGYVEYAPASAGHMAMFKLNGSLLLGTHKLQATEFRDKRSKDAPPKSGKKQQRGKGKKTTPVSCHTSAVPQSHEEEDSAKDPDSASGEIWKVFVGSLNSKQLPSSIQNTHLQKHFKDFKSSIVQAIIVTDRETKQSKGCGFVQFRSKRAAKAAIDKLHGSQLQGCTLKLEFARKKAPSSSESSTGLQKPPKKSTPTTTAPLPSPKRKGKAQPQEQVGSPPMSSTHSPRKDSSTSTTRVGFPLVAKGEELPPEGLIESPTSTEACRVFVGGVGKSHLPEAVQDRHLHHLFREFKPAIVNAYIARHKETKQSKGFGFVQFTSSEVAQKAIAKLNGSILEGCKIRVQYDKSKQKTSTSGAQPGSPVPQPSPTVVQTPTAANYFPPPSPHSLPQSVIPPPNSIAVSNLSPAISKEEISSLCGGTITSIDIAPDSPNSNKAEIRFSSPEEAQEAITRLNGKEFLGHTLSVAFIQPPQPQPQQQVQTQAYGNEFMFPVKITHISPTSSEALLVQQFQNAGEVVDYKFFPSVNRYALINFKQEYEARRAVEMFDGRTIDGWKINVSQKPAVPRQDKCLSYTQPGSLPQPVMIEVSNLNPQLQVHEHWKGLTEIFSKYQSAKVVDVIPPCAYVSFSNTDEAHIAIAHLHQSVIGGSTVHVSQKPAMMRKGQSLPHSQPGYVPQPVTIEVSNLNPQLQVHEHWKGLTEIFTKYQSAKVVDVIPPCAYVRFSDANEAQAAITHLDHTVLGGSTVRVQIQPRQQLPEQGVHTDMQVSLPASDVVQEVIKLTSEQCNLLTAIRTGSSLYQELSLPFKTNPNVKIELLLDDVAIRFEGKQDAVKSARGHFSTQLKHYIPLEQNVTMALLSIFPTLHTTILKNHGVTLTGFDEGSTLLKLDGRTSDIVEARNYIDNITAHFKKSLVTPQIPLTATLLTSARKRLKVQNIVACLLTSEGSPDVTVCSFSPDDHERAVKIVSGKLAVKYVPFQSRESVEQLPQFQKIEDEHSVMVELSEVEKKVYIKSFVFQDVQSAFESMSSSLSVACSPITCSSEQMQYLQHKIRFPDEATQQILASLPAKIIAEGKRELQLQGSAKDVEQAQKEIMEGPLLQGLMYRSFPFRAHHRSFSQIEQHILKPVQKKHPGFFYTKNDNEQKSDGGSRKKRGKKASLEEEFTITIMSQDSSAFEETVAVMETVKPCSKSLKVQYTDAIECVRARIGDTEQRYRVQIVVPKQSNTIHIFGLTEDEAAQCVTELSEYIDSTVVIKKFIPLNYHEAKYLQDKKRDEFQELRRKCRFLKVLDRRRQEEKDSVLIQVEGTVQQVRLVEQEVNAMIGDNFTVQSFSIFCKRKLSGMWQKRWSDIKKEKEQSYDIVVQFTRNDDPDTSDQDTSVEYAFTVFGTDEDGADEVIEVICNRDNGQLIEEKRVRLPPEAIKALFKGLSEKDLHVHDQYTVNMFIDSKRNQVILTAPQECCDDLEAAEEEIQKYIGNRAFTQKEILINDEVIGLMFQSKTKSLSHLTVANGLAKPFGVSVHCLKKPRCGLVLRGTPESISQVEPLIVQQAITAIQSTLGEVKFPVDPTLRPFFSTPEFTHFYAKLRNDLCVVGTFPVLIRPNQVIKTVFLQVASTANCIKLDICKGTLVNERVDAIVNAANEDLCHAGGLARAIVAAGGDVIQQESNQYIQTHGKLKTGSVVCLGAGNLTCKRIIHAVGPCWVGGNSGEEQALYITVFNTLIAAQGEGLESIAIPAISTGIFGVPEDVCVRNSLKAVRDFSQTNPSSCVTNVRFVLLQQKLADLFCDGIDSTVPQDCTVKEEQHQHKPPTKPSSYEYTWHWQDDHGSYTPYSVDLNAKLNEECKHNPQGHLRFKMNSNVYCVDLNTMTQTNENTKHQRRVMKVPVTSSSHQPIQWYFTDDNAKLVPYTPQDSNAIERMFIAGKPSPLTIRGRVYSFDFTKMCQVNVDTAHMRLIIRKTVIDETNSKPEAEQTSEFFEELKKQSVVVLHGPQANLPLAKSKLEEKLKAAMKSNDVCFPVGLEKVITKVLHQHKLSFEIKRADQVATKGGKKFQKVVHFHGLAHNVHLATSAILEEIINYQASAAEGSEIEVPTDWQPQTTNLELFPLAPNSMEWNKVEAHFRATLPSQHIQQISRIQNKWLWERYAQHKQRLAYKNNGAVNEKELFHGTRHNDPKLIYEGEDGFDARFSAQGMWGLANYFAVDASYSNAYAYQASNGYREMFLVKVLTGDSYQCASTPSLRLPPEKPGGSSGSLQFAKTRYDTVTGVTRGSQVYMTYDNDKAYPAYLIQYQ